MLFVSVGQTPISLRINFLLQLDCYICCASTYSNFSPKAVEKRLFPRDTKLRLNC
jgi:hypothetical protein